MIFPLISPRFTYSRTVLALRRSTSAAHKALNIALPKANLSFQSDSSLDFPFQIQCAGPRIWDHHWLPDLAIVISSSSWLSCSSVRRETSMRSSCAGLVSTAFACDNISPSDFRHSRTSRNATIEALWSPSDSVLESSSHALRCTRRISSSKVSPRRSTGTNGPSELQSHRCEELFNEFASVVHRADMLSNSIHGQYVLVCLRLSLPNGGQPTADCAGRVADARTQVRPPNLIFHLNENQQYFGVYLEVVVAAS